MSKNLLIFDFDGTIANTAKVLSSVGNEILIENKLPPITESGFEKIRGMSIKENFSFFSVPLHKLPKLIAGTKKRLHESIDELEPIDGMIELVQRLSQKPDNQLVILTSNTPANVQFFIDKYELQECFSEIAGDVGLFSKAKRMKQLVRRFGSDSEVILSIGDEVRDIEAARKSNLTSLAVDWGFNSTEKLNSAHPLAVLSTVDELETQINTLTG